MGKRELVGFLEYLRAKDNVNLVPLDAAVFLRSQGIEPHDYGFLIIGEDAAADRVTSGILICSMDPVDRPGEVCAECSRCHGKCYHSSGVAEGKTLLCHNCYIRREIEEASKPSNH